MGDETGGGQPALDLLDWWRSELLKLYRGEVRHPVMIALQPTIKRFNIPPQPFLDLITAFEQDQRIVHYQTFDELLGYCQNSANPVGRLVLYLCESFDEQRAALSDHICTSLQLANFWQDVKRDYSDLGRIYLPQEDRLRFGVADDDLHAFRFTPAFRSLMEFEVARTRQLFENGRPLLNQLPRAIRADIQLFLEGGLAILRKIERANYDVLSARPKLSKREKVGLIIKVLKQSATTVPKPAPDTSTVRSFHWCRQLTKRTAKNFRYAFLVLPRSQRRAMDVLYAFMRLTDDIADEPGDINAKRLLLQAWRQALERCLNGDYSHPLHPALHEIVQRYSIPAQYLYEVIDGVSSDLLPEKLASFNDLYAYCYRVASAVGLCCIHIWGFRGEQAKEFAEAAGIAFQLTNILRDLGEDLEAGRVYIPADEIEKFNAPPSTWRSQNENFRRLMQFQVERAQAYYKTGAKLSPYLNASGRAVFQVMLKIYRGLLEEIVRRDYDVFREPVKLSRGRKLLHLMAGFPIRWGWR